MTTSIAAVDPAVHRPAGRLPSRRRLALSAGWPIAMAVAGYPVWWAFGLTPLCFPLAAIPMYLKLRRSGKVRVPPGFWIWLLFLVWVLASGITLNLTAPDTVPPHGAGRFLAYGLRFANYASLTIMMLYIGNLPEKVLPTKKVIRSLGVLCVASIVLGLGGVLFPHFTFSSPAAALLPSNISSAGNNFTSIALAQVQPVLGYSAPRPAAPYAFTNAWGNNVALLLVWLIVGWWMMGGRRRRLGLLAVLAVATVPIVYSLDRGMWIGLGLGVLYVAVRLAARGRLLAIGAITLTLGVATVVFTASPLSTIVAERLAHGHSNESRTSLAGESIRVGLSSPFLGYGSTRQTVGSQNTIAVGATKACPKCGNRDIGSTGQIWLLLIAQGFFGTALYLAYFIKTAWAFRHDYSPVAIAGSLVVLLSLFFGLFYSALIMPLAITFVSIGLVWHKALGTAASGPAALGHRATPAARRPRVAVAP